MVTMKNHNSNGLYGNPYKQQSSFLKQKLPALCGMLIVGLIFIFGNGFLFNNDRTVNLRMRSTSGHAFVNDRGNLVVPRLNPQVVYMDSYKGFYMLPEKEVKGILVHFHECGHGGADFFILPEDRIIAYEALERGLAVLSMNSLDRMTRCWGWKSALGNAPPNGQKQFEDDIVVLSREKTVEKWSKKVGLKDDLPIMVLGASNFVFYAWKAMKVQSIASYILGYGSRLAGFHEDDADRKRNDPSYDLPNSIIFVHMAESDAANDVGFYNSWLDDYVHITSKLIDVKPHADSFTADSCDRTIPELGFEQCQKLIDFIQQKYPHLLENNQPNFKHVDWEPALLEAGMDNEKNKVAPRGLPTVSGNGHTWLYESVMEELNTVIGMNEMIASGKDIVLDFLMCHSNIGPCD